VNNFVASSRFSNAPTPPAFVEMHKRMKAKLLGYLDPARTFQVYKESDNSLESRYARAIAYSRRPDYPKAFALMDSLIAEWPNDGYFIEAKAQMALESGKAAEALPLYQRATELLPNEPLIRIDLARIQVDQDAPESYRAAIENLKLAQRSEPDNGEIWRLLSIAYGRDNQLGMASLAMAERALLQRNRTDARGLAERAERLLPSGSAAWLRAQDIRQAAERLEKRPQ
jgi:predicted Zn-dependent protease